MQQSELKACEACRVSKRKCTKQIPSCRRCQIRHLDCVYEARPQMTVFYAPSSGHFDPSLPLPQCIPSIDPTISVQSGLEPPNNPHLSLNDLRAAWFLTPDTWRNIPIEPCRTAPVTTSMIQKYIDRTHEWLKEWVRVGSSPFIHPMLYSRGMPSCVQDAFMALSTYYSKTDKTSDMVLCFIEEKANSLVASYTSEECPNTLENIGRVHSLLIYCVVRLFDGNVRQRHFAEQHLPTLHNWTKQMLCSVSESSNDSLLFRNALTNYTPEFNTNPAIPIQVSPEQLLWNAWILSESIRRTWSISMGVQSSYELLKTGNGPCYGGILVTTRAGVWDAKTASAWTKACAERSVGLLHRNDAHRLMEEMRMDEIDDFFLAAMEIDVGTERMEGWQQRIEMELE